MQIEYPFTRPVILITTKESCNDTSTYKPVDLQYEIRQNIVKSTSFYILSCCFPTPKHRNLSIDDAKYVPDPVVECLWRMLFPVVYIKPKIFSLHKLIHGGQLLKDVIGGWEHLEMNSDWNESVLIIRNLVHTFFKKKLLLSKRNNNTFRPVNIHIDVPWFRPENLIKKHHALDRLATTINSL